MCKSVESISLKFTAMRLVYPDFRSVKLYANRAAVMPGTNG